MDVRPVSLFFKLIGNHLSLGNIEDCKPGRDVITSVVVIISWVTYMAVLLNFSCIVAPLIRKLLRYICLIIPQVSHLVMFIER